MSATATLLESAHLVAQGAEAVGSKHPNHILPIKSLRLTFVIFTEGLQSEPRIKSSASQTPIHEKVQE